MATAPNPRWIIFGVCLLLAVANWIIFSQTATHDFVNFDDDAYVYENPNVQSGLTANGFVWAFTHEQQSNWHPLTSLSHMLDCQLYGLKPGGHHLTNLLLHTATSILLFLVLRQMTGTLWRSAFVAALFAVHPLRVESVAWISERKDVLSGLFFVLILGAYTRYVRKPSGGRYLLVLGTFALGLLAKSMLVTVPFVLLLLDYWPLRRKTVSLKKLALEKIPFLALSAAACAVTLFMQTEVIQRAVLITPAQRAANAAVSYIVYLKEFFYPVQLAAFYPLPVGGYSLPVVVVALLKLVAVSWPVFYWRKTRPWLVTGWLWYLGMLVPVIGLVQVGGQAHADRYTYLPEIGIAIMLTWGVGEWSATWRNRRLLLAGLAGIALTALIWTARVQTSYWRDSGTLWVRTLEVAPENNAVAHSNLGTFLFHKGELDEAIAHCQQALEIWPGDAGTHNCYGAALLEKGEYGPAIEQLQLALQSEPNSALTRNNLGMAFSQSGKVDEAIGQFEKALENDPHLAAAHNNLGIALVRKGEVAAGVDHYQKAIALAPLNAGAANNLAWIRATSPDASLRNGQQAVELAWHANQLYNGGNAMVLRTLGAAFAEAGRFPEAIQSVNQAVEVATMQANGVYVNTLQQDLRLYQSRQALRDPPPAH